MKRVMCLFASLLLAPVAVLAGETDISWNAPTGSETCFSAPEEPNIAGYRVWQLVAEIDDEEQTSVTLIGLMPGDYTYTASVFTDSGTESRLSGSAGKIIESIAVSVETVYTMVKQPDRFIYLPVGTVPIGTVCDHTQPMGPYFVIPRSEVSWSASIQPAAVVAECS